MARLGRRGFLAVAVIFHVIYAVSIFDIYFVSPIVTGMRAFGVNHTDGAPAKRLVLFVGDGLRADKAFQSFPDPSPPPGTSEEEAQRHRPLAPFLRSRVLEHGTFGVSHTRVPTESRPGHVALIAGLYEDVSAVTTGWKLNPVNFDSVFNRSRHTWSWGSPDILPMFEQGAVPGRIDAYCYGAEEEDYSKDATVLDTWVFDRVKGLFEEAKHNETLNAALHDDKLVFFLHLLGLDTTGHAYRPYSKEYLHNIKVVDEGVREITELIERFYGDGKTAYVFTADHGMSDWGSHGDGHPDNTRTPLIAWGSGVAKPVKLGAGIAPGHEDGFSSDWNLNTTVRNDVAQADVAALMAYLAGLEYPVNSVGELPLPFLDANPIEKARALLVNARGILEMYFVKELQKSATVIRYQPYSGFTGGDKEPQQRLRHLDQLVRDGRYAQAITEIDEFIKLTLQGIRYLQTYDWLFLRTIITLGYAGFVAFAFSTIIDLYVLHGAAEARRSNASTTLFTSVLVGLYAFLASRRSPWTYYAYGLFPVFFWEEVWARRDAWFAGRKAFLGDLSASNAYLGLGGALLAFVGVLEALAQSYFHREAFTICYLLAIVWPAFYGKDFVRGHRMLCATWALSCATLSGFTLLPANKVESTSQILIGGTLMLAVGTLYLLFEKSFMTHTPRATGQLAEPNADVLSRYILGIQTGLIGLALPTTRSAILSIQARTGLALGTQIVGWLVLIASLAVPFLHSLRPNNDSVRQLVVIFLAFAPAFIILTISYEGLFYLAFCTLLFTWTRLERHVYKHTLAQRAASASKALTNGALNGHAVANGTTTTTNSDHGSTQPLEPSAKDVPSTLRALTLTDVRISLFYLYLLQSAFFSTGNIASISSFSLDAVYRLIPVFDPFSQGALLILKILIPYFVLTFNLGVLSKAIGFGADAAKDGRSKSLGAPLGIVAVVMGDWLTVRFFWCVRDEGSWLEIGESITKFLIASMLGAFVSGLEVVGEYVARDIVVYDEEERPPLKGGETVKSS